VASDTQMTDAASWMLRQHAATQQANRHCILPLAGVRQFKPGSRCHCKQQTGCAPHLRTWEALQRSNCCSSSIASSCSGFMLGCLTAHTALICVWPNMFVRELGSRDDHTALHIVCTKQKHPTTHSLHPDWVVGCQRT
jgi:hypothetical protein